MVTLFLLVTFQGWAPPQSACGWHRREKYLLTWRDNRLRPTRYWVTADGVEWCDDPACGRCRLRLFEDYRWEGP